MPLLKRTSVLMQQQLLNLQCVTLCIRLFISRFYLQQRAIFVPESSASEPICRNKLHVKQYAPFSWMSSIISWLISHQQSFIDRIDTSIRLDKVVDVCRSQYGILEQSICLWQLFADSTLWILKQLNFYIDYEIHFNVQYKHAKYEGNIKLQYT